MSLINWLKWLITDTRIAETEGLFKAKELPGEMTLNLGDGDYAMYIAGETFPRIFFSERWNLDLYIVKNFKEWEDFIYNDAFMAVGTPYKPVDTASTLEEAKSKARKILQKEPSIKTEGFQLIQGVDEFHNLYTVKSYREKYPQISESRLFNLWKYTLDGWKNFGRIPLRYVYPELDIIITTEEKPNEKWCRFCSINTIYATEVPIGV